MSKLLTSSRSQRFKLDITSYDAWCYQLCGMPYIITHYTSTHRAKVLTCSNLVLILQFRFVLGNIVLELLFILLEAFHHLKIVIKQRPRKISRPCDLLGSLIFSVNVCKGRLHILQKKSTVIKEKAQRCPAAPIFFLKRSMALFTWRSSTACSFSCCIFDTYKKNKWRRGFHGSKNPSWLKIVGPQLPTPSCLFLYQQSAPRWSSHILSTPEQLLECGMHDQ